MEGAYMLRTGDVPCPGQAPSTRQSDLHELNWKSYTFVDVCIRGLPQNITTLEIYQNFSPRGSIHSISIKNDRSQDWRRTNVDIRFKPPPKEAFWGCQVSKRSRSFLFHRKDGRVINVTVLLSNRQPKHFVVKSPVRPNITYDEEIVLGAESIDFGVFLSSRTMLKNKTIASEAGTPVELILNLYSGKIEVRFPLPYSSINRSAIRRWRFVASLDQAITIISTKHPSRKAFSLLLYLQNPPPFTRRVQETIGKQHYDEARLWREEDLWLRQTDLTLTKEAIMNIRKLPVTIQASGLDHIDLGRWTTYRVNFNGSKQNLEKLEILSQALSDLNIDISRHDDLAIVENLRPVWHVFDRAESHNIHQTELEKCWATTLSFPIRYQLEVCITSGRLSEYNIDQAFIEKLASIEERIAQRILENISIGRVSICDPMQAFNSAALRMPKRKSRIPETCVVMHSATITATTVIVNTPSLELSNRVVRKYKKYADRFLRIRFEDDPFRGSTKIHATTTRKMDEIFVRIKRTLLNGVNIAGRHYVFLAWGNSQLREHGAYFFADKPGDITAGDIRAVMGEFEGETIIAKRAARLGQCFSTTLAIKTQVPDVKKGALLPDIQRNGYLFTDGVGKISPMLAVEIAKQLNLPNVPSGLQFRLGGCKGVLAVSPDLIGIDLGIRESQFKFPCDSKGLEIIRTSEFWNAYLNRQLILVLSALGIDTKVFLHLQETEVARLNEAMLNDGAAITALTGRVDPNIMTPVIAAMVSNGFRASNEPFVVSILHLWRAWSLKYIKEKAHLFISRGALLLGCIDETASLQGHFNDRQPRKYATTEERERALPEIFLQITDQRTKQLRVIEGKCIIARNPSLHLGDVRVVRAVNLPQLRHLFDVVVLPQTGDRDLCSMCSGGDLDGDDYIVIWDQNLIPPNWTAEPFHYEPPQPVRAQGEVTQNDFINFFHQYIKNDFLGRIANAHLGWADDSDEGIESPQCLELTALHSLAVDYPKTGVPAKLPRSLERVEWPHFMERKRGKSYKSRKVLGKLFDNVEKVGFAPSVDAPFDKRILGAHPPSLELLQSAAELKDEYDTAMQRIMAQHEIKTEFEVWSTFVLSHSKSHGDFKFHEEVGRLSKTLKEQFFDAIVLRVGGKDQNALAPFAVAAYTLVQMQVATALKKVQLAKEKGDLTPVKMPLISFPWVLHDVLGNIATASSSESQTLTVENLTIHTQTSSSLPNQARKPNIVFDESGNALIETHSQANQTFLSRNWIGQHFGDPFQPRSHPPAATILDDEPLPPRDTANQTSTESDTVPINRSVQEDGMKLISIDDNIKSGKQTWKDSVESALPLLEGLIFSEHPVANEDGDKNDPFRRGSTKSKSTTSEARKDSAQISTSTESSLLPLGEMSDEASKANMSAQREAPIGGTSSVGEEKEVFLGDPAAMTEEELAKILAMVDE